MLKFVANTFNSIFRNGKKKVVFDGISDLPEDRDNEETPSMLIRVVFPDGFVHMVECDDLFMDYLTIRLLYDANFDRPELIPYLGQEFLFQVLE